MYEFNFILWKIQYIQVYYTAHIQVHSTFIRIHSRERLSGASYSLQPCHFSTSPTHDSLSYLWLTHFHGTTICNWSVLLKMSLVPHQWVAILYSRLAHAVTGVCAPSFAKSRLLVVPRNTHTLTRQGWTMRVPHICMKTKIKEIQCAWSEKCSLQKRRYTNSLKTYENIIWPDINQSSMWQVQIVHTYMYNLYIWRTKQAPQFGRFTCCSNASKSPF